ncbi:hypothetical protein POX_c04375 [Penicillium oxalicum]|uniref:hypothetical protein n=1 Tax=Penicillium oxalicum TaxID=69781 RepID=UPI0020B74DF9|nr:hypothetical protein POX_c04375 [Penicillium oxalicum]KAI2791514.1 hypothetical protein POX_c04375 [Penicillium oxalicum]
MVLGSKKSKTNAKHGKVATKQKNKKAPSPDVAGASEPTEIIESSESQTPAGTPPSVSPRLPTAAFECAETPEPLTRIAEAVPEKTICVNDFLEEEAPAVLPSPSLASLVTTSRNEAEQKQPRPSEQCFEQSPEEHRVEELPEDHYRLKESHSPRHEAPEERSEYHPEHQRSQPSTRQGTPKPSPETTKRHPTYEEAYAQYPSYSAYPAHPAYPTEYPERAQRSSPFAPYPSPPSLVPLPSPSLTEARFMSSASPEAHYYPYYPPPPLPYSPYAASQYSAPYYHSPVPKVSSPLARSHYSYMSPVMSPTATPPPPPPPPPAQSVAAATGAPVPPPSTTHSYASATQSPVMSSAGVVPPYSPYTPPQPHSMDGHYMQRSYSGSSQPYAASFQAIQNLGLGNGQTNENGTFSPPENDQEHIELLQRIQSAIPDINRLLHGFRHTHTRLNSREAEIKQIGNQHEQALMHKDFYIEALQSQMKKTANESAEECAKLKNIINELRLEVGDLQEKQKDLEDGLATHQKTNEELSQSKSDLEAEIKRLAADLKAAADTHSKEIERQRDDHNKALVTQKQELTELFEEIKNEDEKAALETLEAREKELREQHDLAKTEWEKEKKLLEDALENQRGELETLKSELVSTTVTLENKENELSATRNEVASRVADLENKQIELDELRKKNAEELEGLRQNHAGEQDALRTSHASESETLRQTHQEQLAAAAKELEAKVSALETQFQEQEQHWEAERTALQKLLAERDEDLSSVEREKEKLEGDGLMKEQQLQRAVEQMRSTIDNLDHDCDRLRRTLQSLGEATDLKATKGDQFFVDCFAQLSTLIADLSNEYFTYLPIDPPKDILSKIPAELPSFLDNSSPSRALRAAYVQHVVSKTLTYRVFQPFLFTLGRRYDKADTFFQMLSTDIRRKSVRREAFWRQQTLKAAYTTSDAKQSINVAAAVIVDEIIDQIRHFADPRQLDSLLTAVRKIVKLAAETWRHARVERELVIAHFPAPDDDLAESDGWAEYTSREEVTSCAAKGSDQSACRRHVVLRTFPRIVREAAHEDFASEPDRAIPCVYSMGQVLYMDSPVVIARLQELTKRPEEAIKPVECEKSQQPDEKPITPPLTPEIEDAKIGTPVPAPPTSPPVHCVVPAPVRNPQPTGGSIPLRSSTPIQKKAVCLSPPSSPRAKGHVQT